MAEEASIYQDQDIFVRGSPGTLVLTEQGFSFEEWIFPWRDVGHIACTPPTATNHKMKIKSTRGNILIILEASQREVLERVKTDLQQRRTRAHSQEEVTFSISPTRPEENEVVVVQEDENSPSLENYPTETGPSVREQILRIMRDPNLTPRQKQLKTLEVRGGISSLPTDDSTSSEDSAGSNTNTSHENDLVQSTPPLSLPPASASESASHSNLVLPNSPSEGRSSGVFVAHEDSTTNTDEENGLVRSTPTPTSPSTHTSTSPHNVPTMSLAPTLPPNQPPPSSPVAPLKSPGPVGATDDKNDEKLLAEDTYSLLCITPCCSVPFFVSITVCIFQFGTYALLGMNMVDLNNPHNPLGIPVDVSTAVRIAQLVAIMLAMATAHSVTIGLGLMRDGYAEGLQSAFPDITRYRFALSVFLRLLEGVTGLVLCFALIVSADDVIELLLNFTALEFISLFDDAFFLLAAQGFLGQASQENALLIRSQTYQVPERRFVRAGKLLLMALVTGAFFIGWGFVIKQQMNGSLLCSTVYVQFGDDMMSSLGTFSGLYDKRVKSTSKAFAPQRVEYVQRHFKKAKFSYCNSIGSWTFIWTDNNDSEIGEADDPCDWKTRSDKTDTFDLTDTADMDWFIQDSMNRIVVLDPFYLSCFDCMSDTTECSGRGTCTDGVCSCEKGSFGLRCDFEEPCTSLAMDARSADFPGFRSWALEYTRLEQDNAPVLVYNHPVYFGKSSDKDFYQLIFFTGRRWAATFIDSLHDLSVDLTGGIEAVRQSSAAYFQHNFQGHHSNFTLEFVSEPIDVGTPSDSSDPVGVHWFYAETVAEGSNASGIQPVDPTRPIASRFLCSVCNNYSNPCLHSGVCLEGTCECALGSEGVICEEPPVSNGLCNVDLNTLQFDLDGGDCCESTCVNSHYRCGTSPLNNHESSGYFYCRLPADQWQVREVATNNLPIHRKSDNIAISSSGAVMAVVQEKKIGIYDRVGSTWEFRQNIKNDKDIPIRNFGISELNTPYVANPSARVPVLINFLEFKGANNPNTGGIYGSKKDEAHSYYCSPGARKACRRVVSVKDAKWADTTRKGFRFHTLKNVEDDSEAVLVCGHKIRTKAKKEGFVKKTECQKHTFDFHRRHLRHFKISDNGNTFALMTVEGGQFGRVRVFQINGTQIGQIGSTISVYNTTMPPADYVLEEEEISFNDTIAPTDNLEDDDGVQNRREMTQNIFRHGVMAAPKSAKSDLLHGDSAWEDLKQKVKDAYKVLGFTKAKWNNNDDLPALFDLLWSELSSEEKDAAKTIGYNSQSWNEGKEAISGSETDLMGSSTEDGAPYEPHSFNLLYGELVWEDLEQKVKDAYKVLGFTKDKWNNNDDLPALFDLLWSELSAEEKDAAKTIGYSSQLWDEGKEAVSGSETNLMGTSTEEEAASEPYHTDLMGNSTEEEAPSEPRAFDLLYGDLAWEDLEQAVKKAYRVLGFTNEKWNNNDDLPALFDLLWKELTEEEKDAAKTIGYTTQLWNEGKEKVSHSNLLYGDSAWEDLKQKFKDAYKVLGFTKEKWNDGSTPDLFDFVWSELSDLEKEAAMTVGFNEALWNEGKGEGMIEERTGYNFAFSGNGKVFVVMHCVPLWKVGHIQVYEWDGHNWTQRKPPEASHTMCASLPYSHPYLELSSDGRILAFPKRAGAGGAIKEVSVVEWDGDDWMPVGGPLLAGKLSSVKMSSDGGAIVVRDPGSTGYSRSAETRVYSHNIQKKCPPGSSLLHLSITYSRDHSLPWGLKSENTGDYLFKEEREPLSKSFYYPTVVREYCLDIEYDCFRFEMPWNPTFPAGYAAFLDGVRLPLKVNGMNLQEKLIGKCSLLDEEPIFHEALNGTAGNSTFVNVDVNDLD